MLIYGLHPVINFLKYKKNVVKKVYCNSDVYKKYVRDLWSQPIILENRELRKLLNIDEHQGIVADISHFPYVNFEEASKKSKIICILDHIEDPRNLGAIIRNALAFNIDLLVIPNKRACEVNSTVIKTSAGASAIVPVSMVPNINNAIRDLKNNGFWIYGLESQGSIALKDIKFDGKVVIVLGSEGKGIHNLTKKLCDYLVYIETDKKVSSLNVSSASAIAFYKIYSELYVA
ncbi:MAG: 23S rRNA (guanosine(2251)-2'-O)-methyltransferase RlmB [Proteobacteria bacterium]|nr:23S rRNA (guanosine(2251)-2'-O)-methyltransferase RlmB [Pseudomonadota bacterium]